MCFIIIPGGHIAAHKIFYIQYSVGNLGNTIHLRHGCFHSNVRKMALLMPFI